MQLLYNIVNLTQNIFILQINNIDLGKSVYLLSDLGMDISYYLIAIISIYLLIINKSALYSRKFVFLLILLNLFSGFNYIMQLFNIVWLSSSIKFITAIISMLTTIKIGNLIPKLLTVPESKELVTANEKLAEEIQERQQTEIALQKSEARFSSIFAKSALGIAVLDPHGNTLESNPALQEMLGYNELELGQLKRSDYVHPEDILRTNKLDQELMLGRKEYYQIEKRFLRKDGEILWGKATVSLVKDNKGKPQFIIRMIENITHRKQTEIKLAEYQKYLEDLLGERNQQLSQTHEQLSWQSTHDSLTNLINRSEFEKLLGDAVLTAKNYQEFHSLCYIDVDQFQIINDTCGHLAGDELLKEIAKLLNNACRKTDILARIGGDEFAVILYRCNLAQGLRVGQIIQEK
ncbi:MAG TPA: diguanylate cyclase, partial [Allocoleopsis sp.]